MAPDAENKAPAGPVLDAILAKTRERVRRLKTERPVELLEADPIYKRRPRDFRGAFLQPGLRVIAEVKFASPSKGRVYPGEPSAEEACRVARAYLEAGAAALSILTEPDFFQGDVELLRAVRRELPDALLLMKDFVVDVHQLHLARWAGADAVLLIAAALGARLENLVRSAEAMGLSTLVEVHDEAELERARKTGAPLLGVNSRDLRTLETDLGVAKRLAALRQKAVTSKGKALVKPQSVLIAESGIERREDLDELAACGYRGFLVGTSLMRTGRPGDALRELIA